MPSTADLNAAKTSTIGPNKKKPLWPAKTKLFVEQTMREKEDPTSNATVECNSFLF